VQPASAAGTCMTAVIELGGVARNFGEVRALRDVTLAVERGEVIGLLGHNGAGKTTTVRLLTGVLAASAGRVRVFGHDPVTDGVGVRRRTGVLPATPAVDDRLTAEANLRFAAELYGVDRADVDRRVAVLLEELGLADRAGERVGGYSTGMRQRLGLARLLLPEPELLLLDEPTAALDPVAARQVRELIARSAADEGRTVILCTHNLAEAQELCDRVVVLEQGLVVAEGSPEELRRSLAAGRVVIEVDPVDVPDALALLRDLEVVDLGAGRLELTAAREDVPGVLALLIGKDIRVHAAMPEVPSLEDVYFALHERRRR
jgi:ABC-2 type transport system ATP-binding protein